jgi:hypothetical protein
MVEYLIYEWNIKMKKLLKIDVEDGIFYMKILLV